MEAINKQTAGDKLHALRKHPGSLILFLLVVLVVQILCTTVLLFRFSSALRRAGPVLPEGPGI